MGLISPIGLKGLSMNLTVFGFLVVNGVDLGVVMAASVFMAIRIL